MYFCESRYAGTIIHYDDDKFYGELLIWNLAVNFKLRLVMCK